MDGGEEINGRWVTDEKEVNRKGADDVEEIDRRGMNNEFRQSQPFPMVEGRKKFADPESGNAALDVMYNFSEISIRQAFIRKVFLLLMLMLCVVSMIVCLFTFSSETKAFVRANGWFMYIFLAMYIVTVIVMSCFQTARRTVPCNYICAAVVTLSLSMLTGSISTRFDAPVVFLAAFACCICCLIVAFLATRLNVDITTYAWPLTAAFIGLIVFGMLSIIVYSIWRIKVMYLIYLTLGCVFLFAFFALDIQLIMGNKELALSPEEYVFAATNLFIDIVLIFQHILMLFGQGSN